MAPKISFAVITERLTSAEPMVYFLTNAAQLLSFLGRKMGQRLRDTSQLYVQQRAQDSNVIEQM